jgi:hypothetical protein
VLLSAATAVAAPAAFGSFAFDVPARGFEEHCVQLAAGERIRYRYTASAEVDFNIHWHGDKEVHYPVRAVARRTAAAEFTAPHADTYCLMWERGTDGAARVEGAVERIGP